MDDLILGAEDFVLLIRAEEFNEEEEEEDTLLNVNTDKLLLIEGR